MVLPKIIQGGMGAGVSNWRLARAVARRGHLGVVSGTALDLIVSRRLQDGDSSHDMRRALDAFPVPAMAQRVLQRHFIAGGRDPEGPYRSKPLVGHEPSRDLVELIVIANFVEVWLAKEGHDGPVGINYLDKIQAPILPSIYGAMLAKVDVVTMGAGVPLAIPGVLDAFSVGDEAAVDLYWQSSSASTRPRLRFDPKTFFDAEAPHLERPTFLPIVSSAILAAKFLRHAPTGIAGFVIETPLAGGHNAPPRGWRNVDPAVEPQYGPRDEPDLARFAALGLPFWLAGAYGHTRGLEAALARGAEGIQVGTLFAFCEESGVTDSIKRRVVAEALAGRSRVFTDPVASPTGFPFKVLRLEGTNSDPEIATARTRVCDLGYLREAFETPEGGVGWRCPGESFATWQRKGGQLEDAQGRKCLCNGLMANIGLAQRRPDGQRELPLLTSGDAIDRLRDFLPAGASSYRAQDVLDYLAPQTLSVPAVG
ncbi:MAG: nitronate monooxygenase [Planctomycetes bacterium]|nr:nitronate monooxygenase [Planctomycetota bacterium]